MIRLPNQILVSRISKNLEILSNYFRNKRLKSTKENLAAVFYGPNDIRVESRPMPKVNEDEVLLQIACVGICGSDLHFFKKGAIGDFVVKNPMVIGHEASGVVVERGKGVKSLVKGDRVAIEPGVPCRICNFCRSGQYHLCRDVIFCATPPYDGNLTNYFSHPADFCYKLPPHVTLEEGALAEPICCAVHSCRLGKVRIGSHVMILGAGPIGISVMLVARSMGATSTLITDISDYRLEMAKCMGADHLVLIEKGKSVEDTLKEVKKLMPKMPDVTFDCFVSEETIRLGVLGTRPGGRLILVGLEAAKAKVPIAGICSNELHVVGCFRYANEYQRAVDLIASGRIDAQQMISHNFNIKDSLKAFQTASSRKEDSLKIMIHCKPKDGKGGKSC